MNSKYKEFAPVENKVGRSFAPAIRVQEVPIYYPLDTFFVRGGIPWDWASKAIACHGNGGNLAWVIWLQAGLDKRWTVPIKSSRLLDIHMGTRAVMPALRAMEKAGLVSVTVPRGRGPLVTILGAEEEKQRRKGYRFEAAPYERRRLPNGSYRQHPVREEEI